MKARRQSGLSAAGQLGSGAQWGSVWRWGWRTAEVPPGRPRDPEGGGQRGERRTAPSTRSPGCLSLWHGCSTP